MRPVERDRVARRAAEELVDGHAERLRLDVEERVLDAGDRLRDHGPGALPRMPVEIPVHPLPRPADRVRRRRARDPPRFPRDRGRPVRVRDLGPAHEPVVGRRLEEDPGSPAGVAEERLRGSPTFTTPEHTARVRSPAPARPGLEQPLRALPVPLVVDVEPFVALRQERRNDASFARSEVRHDPGPRDLERAVLRVDLGQRLVPACQATSRCDWSRSGDIVFPSPARPTSCPDAASRARRRVASPPPAWRGAAPGRAEPHQARGRGWSRERWRRGRTTRRVSRA